MYFNFQNLTKQNGQAMTEFIIIAFVLLLLTLGLVQLIFVYQTKTNLNYATFEATRAGTLANASPESIKSGFARGMAPSKIRVGGNPNESSTDQITRSQGLANAYLQAYDEITDYVLIQRINPTTTLFTQGSGWGKAIPQWEIEQKDLQGKATLYIPNEHLLYKSSDAKQSGVTIQDANLLKLRITYCMELIVPFANIVFENAYKLIYTNSNSTFIPDGEKEREGIENFNTDCIEGDDRRIPIVNQSIMRMQSPARNYTF